jgi:hypothetical protein
MVRTVPQATQFCTIMRDAINAGGGSSAVPGRLSPEFLLPIRSRVAGMTPSQLATYGSLLASADMANMIAGAVATADIT